MEIGWREGVVVKYNDLGLCFQSLRKYDMAEEYVKQALPLSSDIGNNLNEFHCLCDLSVLKVVILKRVLSIFFKASKSSTL